MSCISWFYYSNDLWYQNWLLIRRLFKSILLLTSWFWWQKSSRISDIFVPSFCKTHPSSISVYPEQLVLWRWILMLNLLIYEFEFSSNIINSKWVTDRFRWLWVLIRDLQLAWINWFLKIYHSTDRQWPIWWPRIFKLWFLVHEFCDRALYCLRFWAGVIILF